MSLEGLMQVNILMQTRELSQHGYYRVGEFGNSTIYANDKMPQMRYLGHFVDDFCRYVRLTDRYNIQKKVMKNGV